MGNEFVIETQESQTLDCLPAAREREMGGNYRERG